VIAARLRGVDLSEVGSGNIGATNVGRALGKGWGTCVLALDIAKGCLPVLFVAPALATGDDPFAREVLASAVGLGAILGHVFSPYVGFRGGKAVATSIGVFGALTWYWIALPLVAYVALRRTTGYISAGSIALAVLLPAAAALSFLVEGRGGWVTVGFAGIACIVILLRHAGNIGRLLRGEEHAAPGAEAAAAPPEGTPGDGG
jgi:glycerol-3-phosphate acyltransferase PlsY